MRIRPTKPAGRVGRAKRPKKKKPTGFPKTLKIGSTEYHVVFMQRLKGAVGMFDDDGGVIYLALNQTTEELEATFFHEILHAIEKEYKLTLGHGKIRKMEYAFQQIFRQLISEKEKSSK